MFCLITFSFPFSKLILVLFTTLSRLLCIGFFKYYLIYIYIFGRYWDFCICIISTIIDVSISSCSCFNKVRHFSHSGYGRDELLLLSYLLLFSQREVIWPETPTFDTHFEKYTWEVPGWRTNFKGTVRCGILDFQQRLALVTSMRRGVDDINIEVIFFAEVIHPKHPAAIMDFKRGWTCVCWVLFKPGFFFPVTLQQCKMLDGDKINSLNFHFTSNIWLRFHIFLVILSVSTGAKFG